MANKRVIIDPPPFSPLQFGLLSAAIDRTPDAPDKWRAGVSWQSHCPSADGTYDPCLTVTRDAEDGTTTSEPDDPPEKEPTTEREDEEGEGVYFLRGATPFTVYSRFDCNPIGFWERAQDLAVQAITRVEGFEVERIFDTGTAPTQGGAEETAYPHLRDDEPLVDDTNATLQTVADVITSNPVDIVEAIGRLESALAECYHGRGVIHVPSVLAAEMTRHSQMTRRNEQLVTPSGHRVALGTGYSGASPSGVSIEDVAWVYATGAVFYYRDDVRVGTLVDMFNRSNNTVQAIAERTYVFGWDCCHLAIPVHVGGIVAGEFDSAGPIEFGES